MYRKVFSALQVASIPVVDNCKRAFENKSVIDDRIFCVSWTTGGRDACQGYSGGPLMSGQTETQNVRYYQIGVVSYGSRCAEAEYPGVTQGLQISWTGFEKLRLI
ncbi:hypothetical protein NQ314_020649 [Rhamnusium bicolor]|uniref:Peptidase S1 domain-containing protein n=1 Tax=Rhamnusium bicolor TaxID=1586634 RepID=A0AAV8WKG1_9CUCU|nr:hypothetical protein NQ314_020649 [Rhamnusium bicolor]